MYQHRQLDAWDHTAMIVSGIQNLIAVVAGAFGGKIKPEGPEAFHPYRTKEVGKGQKITRDNFEMLKAIGDAVADARRP